MMSGLLLSFSGPAARAQQGWHLKKEEDGIRVYTKAAPNSNFKMVRVEFCMNARLSQLAAFLLDVDKQTNWIYNSKNTRLIRRVASNEIIFYSEIGLPWPCTNRDYVSHVWMQQTGPQEMTITARAEPGIVPTCGDKVRVTVSTANWQVTATGKNTLSVVYTVQFDPAGSIPAWLVNMFVAKAPIHTFKKLREEVNKPAYMNAHVDFVTE